MRRSQVADAADQSFFPGASSSRHGVRYLLRRRLELPLLHLLLHVLLWLLLLKGEPVAQRREGTVWQCLQPCCVTG